MLGLISLPYEVLSAIIRSISFDDYYCLGLSCKHLLFLLEEEQMCKLVVQKKIPHSPEAKEAQEFGTGHARSFRRAAKRYEALTSAVPFVVAIVGVCDAFIYCKGSLCYTIGDKLRILDLHTASCVETVVDISHLIQYAPSIGSDNKTGNFLVMYCSHGIVSCLYKTCGSDSEGWLIVFDLEKYIILVIEQLDSTDKIFVRNDADVLYYGTHSELGADDHRKWVIHGYQFSMEKWFDEKIHLSDLVGCEIGSTVCFEFYNGFFYALSNQTSFEVEEIDWTSYYHCVRFPLASPSNDLRESTDNETMWRRQHQEGPIDDRWTVLSLDKDERTGKLNIVESRKEWYMGSSKSQRTYYTTPVVFPDLDKDKDLEESQRLAEYADATSSAILANSAWVPATDSGVSSASQSSASNTTISSLSQMSSTGTMTSSCDTLAIISHNPDPQLAKLLGEDDNPNYMKAPARNPHHTHPGNDGSTQPTYTLAKSRLRAYHTCSQSFMDVVDDPLPSDLYGTQRLRIRCGARHLKQPPRNAQGLIKPQSSYLEMDPEELYDVSEIQYWPPKQDPQNIDLHNDEIYNLLNPSTHLGNVDGVADERSIVYATGPIGKPQALVFISFDPATQLEGLKHWGGLNLKGLGEGSHIDGRAAAGTSIDVDIGLARDDMDYVDDVQSWFEPGNLNPGTKSFGDVNEANRTVVVELKGKGKAHSMAEGPVVHVDAGTALLDGANYGEWNSGNKILEVGFGRRCSSSWIWSEKPMHMDLNRGYYFGRPKKGASIL